MLTTQEILGTKTIAELTQTLTLQRQMKEAAENKLAEVKATIAAIAARDYSAVKRDGENGLVEMAKERDLLINGRKASKFTKVDELRAALKEDDQREINEWEAEIALREKTIAELDQCIADLDTAIQNAEAAALTDELTIEVENQAPRREAVKNLRSRILPIGYEMVIIVEGQPNGIEAYFKNEYLGSFTTILQAHRAIGKHAPRQLPDNFKLLTANGLTWLYKKNSAEIWQAISDNGEFLESEFTTAHAGRAKYNQAERLAIRLAGKLEEYVNR